MPEITIWSLGYLKGPNGICHNWIEIVMYFIWNNKIFPNAPQNKKSQISKSWLALSDTKLLNINQNLYCHRKGKQRKLGSKDICAELHLTLWDPINYSLPGSSVHGILYTRKLEWVAISFSRESSPPRDWTWAACIAGGFFTIRAVRDYIFQLYLMI